MICIPAFLDFFIMNRLRKKQLSEKIGITQNPIGNFFFRGDRITEN